MPPVAHNRTSAASPVQLSGGKIAFALSEDAPVAVSIHDVGGRQLFAMARTYGSGTHVIRVPAQCAGILLCTVTIGSEAYSFKSSPLGISTAARAGGSSGTAACAKQAKASETIADVICVVKEGQLDYRDSIRTSDTSGIEITMIPNAGNVTDADGNVYQSVRIGNQVWTVENLRTTTYNDGTPTPRGGYCFYNNATDPAERKKWGALYPWSIVATGKLAPAGWHVPTDAEWSALESNVAALGYNNTAKALSAKTDWVANTFDRAIGNDLSKNNTTGFSALPAGCRNGNGDVERYYRAFWWTASEPGDDIKDAILRTMHYISDRLARSIFMKVNGFSVRLVRD